MDRNFCVMPMQMLKITKGVSIEATVVTFCKLHDVTDPVFPGSLDFWIEFRPCSQWHAPTCNRVTRVLPKIAAMILCTMPCFHSL
jgi:hypothetical protein